MSRESRRQRAYRMLVAIMMLVVFLVTQYESLAQTASGFYAYQYWEAVDENVEPALRTWICEDNRAKSVVFFHEGWSSDARTGRKGVGVNRFRVPEAELVIWMELLLLLILTALLLPRRRFMRELEQEASHSWCGPLLVHFQHLWDGEKEGRCNFLVVS